jgi:zinc protease
MAIVHTGTGMEALGRLFTAGTATAAAEAELLERFVLQGDSSAFELLLKRHGPMVLRVCRGILDDPNDVDDAFQATFLILVKNAASIRERAALGTWLYGVARRVAVRARVNARRRNSHERSDAEALAIEPLRESHDEARELRILIEAELERLPNRYRDPLVLCDLEGQTHEQAAAQLRCPVGTVKSRLSRGRARLRARLVRRGVAPAAAFTSLLAAETTSAVPIALIKDTARTAAQLVAGRALAAGACSAQLIYLVQGVMRSMIASKLKIAAGAALAVSLTVGGVLTFVPSSPARPALVREPQRLEAPAKTAAAANANNPARPAEPGSERFVLENGLTVILRPIKGTETTALIVLYSIGNDHDPAGKSGLAHLLEHTYVTAAAGAAKARTADDFARRYAEGANGQTGDRYTVFATVFPKSELETELKDAAARMGDLRLDAGDLARERPRLLAEVGNMFGDFPMLAALNHARELVRPTSGGGRRGGLRSHVSALTTEELQARWKRYYKPRNATVAVSGAVEPAAARKLIAKHFGPLPAGDDLPPPHEPAQAKLGQITELKVQSRSPDAESTACLAYAAPAPGSQLYAPFLLLVARLWADAERLGDSGPTGSPVYFTPLDDGAVVALSTPAKPGENAAAALARIESFVAESIAPGDLEPELKKFERMTARQQFGFLLGLVDLSDSILTANPYGVAFSLGRRDQLKLSSAELKQAWDAITEDQLRRAAREVFAPERHAGAFIRVDK